MGITNFTLGGQEQMQISAINLSDPESVRLDESGRSAAYFCRRTPIKVDADLVAELKKASSRLGGNNVRLCLHDSPEAAFHEMINLEHRGKYYRPHKHLTKGESYHLIEGSMGAIIFDEDGKMLDANVLEPQNNFLYRVGTNMYHAVMPLTDLIIYHESKPGPFLLEGDSVFAPWSPDGSDDDAVAEYVGKLEDMLRAQ